MKKLKTLFKKDPKSLGRVINQIHPENKWVFEEGIPTRKFDGTSCAIINGELYKRYDAKIDKVSGDYKKPIPVGAIPCQKADSLSGHHPHWVKCDRTNNADKYHFEGFDALDIKTDGTYELCGEKIQKNPEQILDHQLIKHGSHLLDLRAFDYEALKVYLSNHKNDIEGIVFYRKNSTDMCKIRKSDFGIKRKTQIITYAQKDCVLI